LLIAGRNPLCRRSPSNGWRTMIPEITKALKDRIEDVVVALLGKPTSKSPHELRWGQHGSLSLRRSGEKRGLWFDFERGEGGDLLDLIAHCGARLCPVGSNVPGVTSHQQRCRGPPQSRAPHRARLCRSPAAWPSAISSSTASSK